MALKRESITLCLIQCGQTTWEHDGRIHGSTDLPLSDTGREEVHAELHRMDQVKAATIYHPPDEAASETAQICAQHIGAKTKAVKELADPNLGLLEGLTELEFSERFPSRHKQWEDDILTLSPPEGEDVVDAADQLFRAIAKLLRRTRSDEVAIVLHPLALGMVRCWMSDLPLSDVHSINRNRPRMERYIMPSELIPALENAVATAYADS